MDCSEFRGTYSDFADGLLDEIQEIAAHRHMSECPACRRLHDAVQRGVAELRNQPRVLLSDDFHERLERRLGVETPGLAPVAVNWPGAAAVLMSLTLLGAGALGWELARGGPGNHTDAADAAPPVVSGIYAPRQVAAVRELPLSAIPFDSADLSALPHAGEFAAVFAGQ